MRNLKSVLSIWSLILLSSLNFVKGQPPKRFDISTRIQFQAQTEKSEIKVPVFQQGVLTLIIRSTILEGELTIELYDAKGEKQANFFIANQAQLAKPDTIKKPINEAVKGEISKKFDNPVKGEWVVRIIPKNAGGFLEINSSQNSRQ
jgi:hypothetical protein